MSKWPIGYVLSEILRVAASVGVSPHALLRDRFTAESDVSTKCLHFYGGWKRLRLDAANQAGIVADVVNRDARGVQLRTAYVADLERKQLTSEYLTDRLENMLVRVFEQTPLSITNYKAAKPAKRVPIERELVSLISDTHYGLAVDSAEVPSNNFSWTTASRRTAALVEQLVEWKPEHRHETTLTIVLCGDLISGAIHTISEGTIVLLTEQVYGATSILVQAIDYLRPHFKRIRIVGVSGNHDRFPHRGGRATSAKWDSLFMMIALGLRYAFRTCPEVTFDFPRTPYVTFELPGGNLAYATHGDTVIETGNVGKNIAVEQMARKIYELDASRTLKKAVSVAMFGHVHVPCNTMLSNGCELIVNGSLSGTDAYAQSVGYNASHPTQVVFESTAAHPVGDFRKLKLKSADGDASLDRVITPPLLPESF